ncbi:MAG: nicotinate (nicotinamide) nucleotide adenylyltransferase [Gammaproteobacteria bacterium]|nr:nicotinate (nicotinamide) nucleotide adenylyltransferase [Gammaproteobacteria bacterium]
MHLTILGGTFDPIHNGHLQIATYVLDKLNLEQIIFIPNNTQAHRTQACATPEQRLAMLKLALDSINNSINKNTFIINTCELDRSSNQPSYTIDTIVYLKTRYPDHVPWLILGRDAFNSLPTWHNSSQILTSCNFIVLNRVLNQIDNKLNQPDQLDQLDQSDWSNIYLQKHVISLEESKKLTNNNIYGAVILLDNPMINISATMIRDLIKQFKNKGLSTQEIKNNLKNYLPITVLDYILKNNLYR